MKLDPSSWLDKTVLVYGDPGYDVYEFGDVQRVSPEAPVPVFIPVTQERRPGLAANVAHQLIELGVTVRAHFPEKPWTTKTRYLVGHHQLLRVDQDKFHIGEVPVPDLDGVDAVVISDYAKGWVHPNTVRDIISLCNRRNIPTVVDPKTPDWLHFTGCTVICPNTKELGESEEYWRFSTILHKMGPDGIELHHRGIRQHFPAKARNVYDVTGAGDTVVAIVAASLAGGMDLEEACIIANLGAGIVVGEVGTSVVSLEDLSFACHDYEDEQEDQE